MRRIISLSCVYGKYEAVSQKLLSFEIMEADGKAFDFFIYILKK